MVFVREGGHPACALISIQAPVLTGKGHGSLELVRTVVFILGPMVLASYVIGLRRMEDPMSLWGGIPESWRPLNVTCMFIAAAGFLIAWWHLLFSWEYSVVEGIGWHGGEVDTGGHARLLIAMLLINSVDALARVNWIHRNCTTLTQWLVRNLWLVVCGNVLLIMMGWVAWQSGVEGTGILPFVGGLMLGIQVIVNDGILWVWKYPW